MEEIPNFKERGETVFKGENPFEDARGKILNYTLPESINLIGLITSKKGCMRANHYHPVQEQKVLLVTGKYISVHKELLVPESQIKYHVVKAGDCVITPPMVAHTMIFLEDSTFLNLVNGNRDHDKYGQHTIPYQLVRPEEVSSYISKLEELA